MDEETFIKLKGIHKELKIVEERLDFYKRYKHIHDADPSDVQMELVHQFSIGIGSAVDLKENAFPNEETKKHFTQFLEVLIKTYEEKVKKLKKKFEEL